MIEFPTTIDGLTIAAGKVARAGGTDLQERLRHQTDPPAIVDLTGLDGFAGIDRTGDTIRIGAGTRMAVVAREFADSHPALAITSGSLATPQVRAHGTIGGNLTQRTRCWYYRHPEIECFKSGGDSCPARTGRHLYGVVFDNSDCVHPHPSSIAMALLAYDATVTLASGTEMSVADLLGDGVDPTRDSQLPDGDIIVTIHVPQAWDGEQGAYFRSISRFEAEWPLVEAVVRARLVDGTVADCTLGLGGVATVPLRMREAESMLAGRSLDDETIAEVAHLCTDGARPLTETGYKLDLIEATVTETLERLRR